jgi:YYY domain-containing protein
LFLPFFINFKPIATSIGFVHSPSPLGLIFLLWGFWGFLTASFVFLFWTKRLEKVNFDYAALIFMAIAFSLIILTEIIYVKDIYGGDYYRSNTVFKVTYQSWILLAISCAYALSRIKDALGQKSGPWVSLWLVFFLFFFAFTLLYPILAVRSYYDSLRSYRGLDGIHYLESRYPEDFAAIEWFQKNIKGQPVIVEATGESYTDYARISANTGLPAVVGWPIHEWLWRGTYDIVAPRNTDVQTIYESQDINEVKLLLSKYQVQYVYVGKFEREKYSSLAEDKFNLLGKIVFEKGQTRIYQVF